MKDDMLLLLTEFNEDGVAVSVTPVIVTIVSDAAHLEELLGAAEQGAYGAN